MPAVSSIAALSLPVSPAGGNSRSAGDDDAFSAALDRIRTSEANRPDQKISSPRSAADPPARPSSDVTGNEGAAEQGRPGVSRPSADDMVTEAMPAKASLRDPDATSERIEPDPAEETQFLQIAGRGDPSLAGRSLLSGEVADAPPVPPRSGRLETVALPASTLDEPVPGMDADAQAEAALIKATALGMKMTDTALNGSVSRAALIAVSTTGLPEGMSASLALSALPRKLDPAAASLVQASGEEGLAGAASGSGSGSGSATASPGMGPGPGQGPAANASSFSLANALTGLTGALTGASSQSAETGPGNAPQGGDDPAPSTMGAQIATQIAAQSGQASSGQVNLATAAALASAAGAVPPGISEAETPDTLQSLSGSSQGIMGLASTDTAAAAFATGPSLAAIETTAQLALQIARRVEGRTTRFDMALTPEGLGRVDVSLDIDADGGLSARLAFDNPAAASELRGRADELRRQLQEAGFSVGSDSLSFSEREAGTSGGGSDRRFEREAERAFAGASRLNDEIETSITPPTWAPLTQTPQGVDLKV